MGPAQVKLLTAMESRIKGDYDLAISLMNEFIAETNFPGLSFNPFNPFIADVKTKLGTYKESIDLMNEFLKTDNSSAE